MTKAERIYKATKYSCMKHIKSWGFDNVGFNRLSTDDLVYKRTVNEIKKLIHSDKVLIRLSIKYGVITEEEAKIEIQAIKMVELTLENQYIA